MPSEIPYRAFKLKEFPHPDHVGQSEYRAIHECLIDALDSDPDAPLDEAQFTLLCTMLGEFEDWAKQLQAQLVAANHRPDQPPAWPG